MPDHHKTPTAPGTLVTRKEIQAMTGLGRSRVHQVTSRADFPAPVDDGDDHRHPIWRRADVERWQAAAAAAGPDAE